jgi:DNA transformation protein and related proteins
MASDQEFVDYVCDQMRDANGIKARKMFGEYAIYSGDKVVALVCDNQLFVKPTSEGKHYLVDVIEASPYPKAKPHYLIDDRLDDRPWLSSLIVVTERGLPAPKPKKVSKSRKVKP